MNDTANVPAAINTSTLGGITALSDQLEAAVDDVFSSWDYFRWGGDSAKQESPKDASDRDRIARTGETMQLQISRLRDLAQAMRERA